MATAPRIWTVAPDGRGDFPLIQAALDAAQPGDTVRVQAGTYTEDVQLRQGVQLRGEGPEHTHLIAAVGNALRGDNVSAVVVADLSIDGAHKAGRFAVYLIASEVAINHCVITGGALSGILAANKSHVTLRSNILRGNEEAGVGIVEEAEGVLEKNLIAENKLHGIEVRERGRLTARDNTLRGNEQAGVLIHQEAEGVLEKNLIAENKLHGIEVRERGRLTARDNTLRGNEQVGVLIHQEAEGVLEKNLIAENKLHGIEVRERGRLTGRNNTILRNAELGVWVRSGARAELHCNIIAFQDTKDRSRGVRVTGNADETPAAAVSFSHNCLWGNRTNYFGEVTAATDILADPRFVDTAGGDYHLHKDSPCRGAGEKGEDLGAFPFEPPAPPIERIAGFAAPLTTHLRTLPLCHVTAREAHPSRPAVWLRGAGAAGWPLPLGLARDLGLLLTQPPNQLTIAKPTHLSFDEDTSAYLAFLHRFASHSLVRELPAWQPPLPDTVLGIILARLVEGLNLPEDFRPPSGPEGVRFLRLLGEKLAQADAAQIWRETPADQRPSWRALLPPESLARIERNLRGLDRDELRFLVRYGTPLAGSPDPRDLLDLLALTGVPEATRLALSQTLKLLPRVSEVRAVGGVQTYPEGGYEGLARQGSLDSLLPSEAAYPEAMFFHRVLNHEALYYGRERPRDRRRELAYLVMQVGYGLGGDGQVLARALLLALGQTLRQRGYDVLYSIAGSELTEPRPLDKPGEVARALYHYEPVLVDGAKILGQALRRLRQWREEYRARQVLWVVSEFFDADDAEDHDVLYQALKAEAGQQAWYVRIGNGTVPPSAICHLPSAIPRPPPPSARYFERWQMIETSVMWENQKA